MKNYPISICYHGFVLTEGEVLPFRHYIEDFKSQVLYLQSIGYTFLKSSEYYEWWKGDSVNYPGDKYAVIFFDDGLETVSYAADWLVANNIKFNIPIIVRRHRKKRAESGYMHFENIFNYVDTGLCEIQYHSYNLHNLCLNYTSDGEIESSGPLEGNIWIDDCMNLYTLESDTRYYWDYTHVDNHTFGWPLAGTDLQTGLPITSEFTFPATRDITATGLRFFTPLHRGTSYDCNVKLYIGPSGEELIEVVDTILEPYDYETRSQWKEREFVSVSLDTPYEFVNGNVYTIRSITQNTGPGIFRVFGIPRFSKDIGLDDDEPCPYHALSNCTSVVVGLSGYDSIGYAADFPWPCIPATLIISGSGSVLSEDDWKDYIRSDFDAANESLNNFVRCDWNVHTNDYGDEDDAEYLIPLVGNYEDGTKCDTIAKFVATEEFDAYVMRWKNVEMYGVKHWGNIVDVSISDSPSGDWTLLRRCSINWYATYSWQEFELEEPYHITPGTYWIRFQTLSDSPWGQSMMSAYINKSKDPGDIWIYQAQAGYDQGTEEPGVLLFDFLSISSSAIDLPSGFCYPFGIFYDSEINFIWPTGISQVNTPLQEVFEEYNINHAYSIWGVPIDREADDHEYDRRITQYTLPRLLAYGPGASTRGLDAIRVYTNNQDYQEQAKTYGGNLQVALEADAYSCPVAKDVNYHYLAIDAYYFKENGVIQEGIINDGGYYCSFSDYPSAGYTGTESITGSNSLATADIKWFYQSDVELENISGTFEAGETLTISDGTSAILETDVNQYYDMITHCRNKGQKVLLILSNYNDVIDDVDADLAAHVLDNMELYYDRILEVAERFDGITGNLEGVPETYRAKATAFYTELSKRLHVNGKLFHITAPATTGTDYDWPSWVGWCDHGALVKVVDMMKIMSYTEAFEGTEPRSAAPDWFFEQVIDYTKKVIPHAYWSRITLGASSFGHVWHLNDTSQNGYSAYHDNMAQGFFMDGTFTCDVTGGNELVWETSSQVGRCGTGRTVSRAASAASLHGFQGNAVWLANSGDKNVHFPNDITMGRLRNVVKVNIPMNWPYEAECSNGSWRTNNSLSGKTGNIWNETALIFNLRNAIQTQDDLDFLRVLYNRCLTTIPFLFYDIEDYMVDGSFLGYGDGTQVSFQARKLYSNGSWRNLYNITNVELFLNGTELTYKKDYTFDKYSGMISFINPPSLDSEIIANILYQIKMKFTSPFSFIGSINDFLLDGVDILIEEIQ